MCVLVNIEYPHGIGDLIARIFERRFERSNRLEHRCLARQHIFELLLLRGVRSRAVANLFCARYAYTVLISVFMCVSVCEYIYIHVLYVHIYAYIYTYAYIYIYIYIYMYISCLELRSLPIFLSSGLTRWYLRSSE